MGHVASEDNFCCGKPDKKLQDAFLDIELALREISINTFLQRCELTKAYCKIISTVAKLIEDKKEEEEK